MLVVGRADLNRRPVAREVTNLVGVGLSVSHCDFDGNQNNRDYCYARSYPISKIKVVQLPV